MVSSYCMAILEGNLDKVADKNKEILNTTPARLSITGIL